MSLTNPKNVITEERLADFYQQILPYLGGMPDILANKFSRGDLYSTDEKMIGRWIDGKPVYQKTIQFSGITSSITEVANISSMNVAHCIDIRGYIDKINSDLYYMRPLPFSDSNETNIIRLDISENKIRVCVPSSAASSWEGYSGHIIIQYTKTTDSSVEIGNDTDYSTTEKIVGTWIDGKPIYQKTIDCGTLPNKSVLVTDLSTLYIDVLTSFDGVAVNLSTHNARPLPMVAMESNKSNDIRIDYSVENNTGKLLITTNADWTSYNGYVTIRYTKTTD